MIYKALQVVAWIAQRHNPNLNAIIIPQDNEEILIRTRCGFAYNMSNAGIYLPKQDHSIPIAALANVFRPRPITPATLICFESPPYSRPDAPRNPTQWENYVRRGVRNAMMQYPIFSSSETKTTFQTLGGATFSISIEKRVDLTGTLYWHISEPISQPYNTVGEACESIYDYLIDNPFAPAEWLPLKNKLIGIEAHYDTNQYVYHTIDSCYGVEIDPIPHGDKQLVDRVKKRIAQWK